MKAEDVRALLKAVASGETTPETAAQSLVHLPFEDLGFARVDHHRHLRTGLPEVVFGPGKTPEQISEIVASIRRTGQTALVTRVDPEKAATVLRLSTTLSELTYEPVPRLLLAGAPLTAKARGQIVVLSAGTADRPVAEEAARTVEIFGHPVTRISDVGVAGLHRLLAVREQLEAAEVLIVVAGMEGALPSVVKGLVSRPVIAVPTSIGFGANFGGLSALLGMLAACTPGMTVVNIDNGFGAAYSACLINAERR